MCPRSELPQVGISMYIDFRWSSDNQFHCPNSGIGANSKLKHWCPNLGFCPSSELGQKLKLGHHGKILFKLGHQCHWQWICPNSELGQHPTWGTSVSTSDLPQFRTRAMSNLGHQCYNFEFAPILKFWIRIIIINL